GIEPVAVKGAEHELGKGQVVFRTIPELDAGAELILQVKARADRPGNHVFRAEILCRALGTKLASEETTLYYGKDLAGVKGQATSPGTAAKPLRGPAPLDTGVPADAKG